VREIYTEIVVRADAGTVWDILLDFDAYPLWNPFITKIRGTPALGARLECRPRLPGRRRTTVFHPRISRLEPQETFAWLGHVLVPGLADGEHLFEISREDDTAVKLVHRQEFRGLLIPVLWPFFHEGTRRGFERMNEALRRRAEGHGAAGS